MTKTYKPAIRRGTAGKKYVPAGTKLVRGTGLSDELARRESFLRFREEMKKVNPRDPGSIENFLTNIVPIYKFSIEDIIGFIGCKREFLIEGWGCVPPGWEDCGTYPCSLGYTCPQGFDCKPPGFKCYDEFGCLNRYNCNDEKTCEQNYHCEKGHKMFPGDDWYLHGLDLYIQRWIQFVDLLDDFAEFSGPLTRR